MTIRRMSTNHTHVSIRTRSTGSFRSAEHQHYRATQHQQREQYTATPFFSVIICTYNRRNMVLTALASLRKQTLSYQNFEVIIVDNDSSDGTFNAVQTYLMVDHVQRRNTREPLQAQCLQEKRNGLAHARNMGLAAASGEVAVFLDDDVIADPLFLEHLYSAYKETAADAIGGSVDIHWEAQRPYWLSDEMLDTLGRYMPFRARTQLPISFSFSNSCFSVKRTAVLTVGGFSPFLSKRLHTPISVEIIDLCRRLRQEGYQLWYEPKAEVLHRVTQARLERPFMLGRAYWQGRSEILAAYADVEHYQDAAGNSFIATLRSIIPELGQMLFIMFIHRLLLYLTRKPMNERLYTAMAQSRSWGRIQQQCMLSNHAPATSAIPAILLVHANEQDAAFLLRGLQSSGAHCLSSIADIPLGWLWRHRAHEETVIGVVHVYRPGAFLLNHWQRQRLLCKLWLAQRLGISIVSTDAGGWWQNVRHIQYYQRRSFELRVFACSQLIHTYVRRSDQFYAEYKWRHRVRFLAHPGLRGTLTELDVRPASKAEIIPEQHRRYVQLKRLQARRQLGVPPQAGFVYLCFAELHSEPEVLHLMGAFTTLRALQQQAMESPPEPQLLIVGTPHGKKKTSQKILQRAALNPAIHLFLEYHQEYLATYVGATNALVMPYFAVKSAGVIDTAMLFYSYERIVITSDIPRFYGLLPPYATIQYKPSSQTSLIQALLTAQKSEYQHTAKEAAALDCAKGWINYVRHMMETYKQLLTIKQRQEDSIHVSHL